MLTTASNASANTAIRYLKNNAADASNAMGKLSSGSRIVKASDDAASLAVGTKIKADVTTLKMAQTNSSHAQSLLQVADGGMARIGDMLQRMKALATQANSGSVSNAERGFIDQEYQALNTQIDAIANNTKFNGQALLNGSAGKAVTGVDAAITNAGISVSLSGNATAANNLTLDYDDTTGVFTLTDGDGRDHTVEIDTSGLVYEGTINFAAAGVSIDLKNFDPASPVTGTFDIEGSGQLEFQVGVTQSERIAVNISNVTTGTSGLGTTGSSLTTQTGAQNAATAVDTAISRLNTARANNGSLISRFEFASANLATQVENLDAARSTLMDVDVAEEMTRFSSANVLQQAATAMLAQANQMPQNLLRLLQ